MIKIKYKYTEEITNYNNYIMGKPKIVTGNLISSSLSHLVITEITDILTSLYLQNILSVHPR